MEEVDVALLRGRRAVQPPLAPRPDRGFMAGTKRKRCTQANRGREAVTVTVAVAEAETERTRETSPRMNEVDEEGGRKGTRRVAAAVESRGREEIRKWSKGKKERVTRLPGKL